MKTSDLPSLYIARSCSDTVNTRWFVEREEANDLSSVAIKSRHDVSQVLRECAWMSCPDEVFRAKHTAFSQLLCIPRLLDQNRLRIRMLWRCCNLADTLPPCSSHKSAKFWAQQHVKWKTTCQTRSCRQPKLIQFCHVLSQLQSMVSASALILPANRPCTCIFLATASYLSRFKFVETCTGGKAVYRGLRLSFQELPLSSLKQTYRTELKTVVFLWRNSKSPIEEV